VKKTMEIKTNIGGGGIGFFGILTIVFIVLKLLGIITWSWLWVLAPTWIPIAIVLLIFIIVFIFMFIGSL